MIAAVESHLRAAGCEPLAEQRAGLLEVHDRTLEARVPPEPAPPPVKEPSPEDPENANVPAREPDPDDPFEI
jgi:hypothetical protein